MMRRKPWIVQLFDQHTILTFAFLTWLALSCAEPWLSWGPYFGAVLFGVACLSAAVHSTYVEYTQRRKT